MMGKLTFLGTGGSVGVPIVGCSCAVCHSDSPFNKRLRPSVLIQVAQKIFLIDAGPDFRLQALRQGISTLDGVLFTHAHHDHTAGIDDLRPIYYRRDRPLPFLLSNETAQEIQTRFPYMFSSKTSPESFVSPIQLQLLPAQSGQVVFEGLAVQYMTYEQGGMAVNGFRLGNLAYISDIRNYPKTIFDDLNGVKILILSALRYTHSPLHFSVDEAIDFAKEVKAEEVWLTHISHDLEHLQTNAYLPSTMRLAYDGLSIQFE